jgi:hypothetical protein
MALPRVNRRAAAICCRNSGNRPSLTTPFCELVLKMRAGLVVLRRHRHCWQ